MWKEKVPNAEIYPVSALKNFQILDNAYGVLGIELMAAAQALDFRKHKLGKGVLISKNIIRKYIDFLDIDVEGADFKVLEGLSFEKFKPKLICVEIHLKDKNHLAIPLKFHPTYLYLKSKKYKIIWNKGYNFMFAKNGTN